MQRPRYGGARDAGFTLVEVIVAISVITVVLGSATSFFVRSMAVTHLQGDRQTAVQLAADGLERIRAVPGSELGSWFPGELPGCERKPGALGCHVVDEGDSPRTVTMSRTVNGVAYTQVWTITSMGGTDGGGFDPAGLTRVVVAVRWPASDCPRGRCTYKLATLISAVDQEPVFNAGAPS